MSGAWWLPKAGGRAAGDDPGRGPQRAGQYRPNRVARPSGPEKRHGRAPRDDMPPADSSLLLPTFLRRLADPDVKTVLLCGCGGGFDFVHSLLLYPELQ